MMASVKPVSFHAARIGLSHRSEEEHYAGAAEGALTLDDRVQAAGTRWLSPASRL